LKVPMGRKEPTTDCAPSTVAKRAKITFMMLVDRALSRFEAEVGPMPLEWIETSLGTKVLMDTHRYN